MAIPILFLPLMLWFSLRQISPQSRRKFDRFRMSSTVKVMLGDRELTGQMNTISLGGLSFNADEALEKGHNVTLKIASPDGKDLVEVEGRIVWSEENKNYGVQFAQNRISVLDKINAKTLNQSLSVLRLNSKFTFMVTVSHKILPKNA